ncbi:MAG: hypothetical protein K0R73_28 [Candidatus Midichloriaceae bacterium]|jgi:hypothetical protein|nr:hypothetical protein [Candidatus Midichloriaceae bacterium]
MKQQQLYFIEKYDAGYSKILGIHSDDYYDAYNHRFKSSELEALKKLRYDTIRISRLYHSLEDLNDDSKEFLKVVTQKDISVIGLGMGGQDSSLPLCTDIIGHLLSKLKSIKSIIIQDKIYIENQDFIALLITLIKSRETPLLIQTDFEIPKELENAIKGNKNIIIGKRTWGPTDPIPEQIIDNLPKEALEALVRFADSNFSIRIDSLKPYILEHLTYLYFASMYRYEGHHSSTSFASLIKIFHEECFKECVDEIVSRYALIKAAEQDDQSIFSLIPAEIRNKEIFGKLCQLYFGVWVNLHYSAKPQQASTAEPRVEEVKDEEPEVIQDPTPLLPAEPIVIEDKNTPLAVAPTPSSPLSALGEGPKDITPSKDDFDGNLHHKMALLASAVCLVGIAYIGFKLYRGDVSISNILGSISLNDSSKATFLGI